MALLYEIVHRCNDRVFDLESYERTTHLNRIMEHRSAGYYVLIWPAPAHRDDTGKEVSVLGPFFQARHAEVAAAAFERIEPPESPRAIEIVAVPAADPCLPADPRVSASADGARVPGTMTLAPGASDVQLADRILSGMSRLDRA